jgi:alpha-D-ribose 1-methylphosphonate 5-triphosphate synthase subunit PhnG
MSDTMPPTEIQLRRDVMSVLARATEAELLEAVEALPAKPVFRELRSPEAGLVMVRGRMGGDGAPFNLGEATVTRAAVMLETGETGFAYLLGHRPRAAKLAALLDALWQRPDMRPIVEAGAVAPIRARIAAEEAKVAAQTAATRVDFFTLVRGEDAA